MPIYNNCSITPSEILTLIISGLAFFISCVSALIAWLNYKRDNRKVILRLYKNQIFLESKDKNEYTILDIYNGGRRPLIITNVGYQFLKKKGGAIFREFINIQGDLTINEQKHYSFKIQQNKICDIAYFIVCDSSGRSYKIYVANIFISYIYKFLRFFKK
jgi:hypothetical protein